MSYEGDEEYLCERGHYYVRDTHSSHDKKCTCGARWQYRHSVDHTNGIGYLDRECKIEDPNTVYAEKTEFAFDDIRNEDHYGTVYFTKWERYLPTSQAWEEIQDGEVEEFGY